MRTFIVIGVAVCALCTGASAQTNTVASVPLANVSRAADRIASVRCSVERAALFQGAIDSINAMPERTGLTALRLTSPTDSSFADTFTTALNQGGAATDAIEAAAITGMVRAADPNGDYWDRRELAPADVWLRLANNEPPTVLRVAPDGPASRGGVMRGDVITSVDGRSVAGMRTREVRRMLRGDAGASVSFTVDRDGRALSFSLERAQTTPESGDNVEWRVERDIGIISLLGFGETSAASVKHAIQGIYQQAPQVRGFILDLRDNGGGLLDQTFEVAGQFIERGAVARTRTNLGCPDENEDLYNVQPDGDETRGAPLVVLVNANTSRGAELGAATLRERRGAILIGQTTDGDARIQTMIPIITTAGQYTAVSLTYGELTPPSGRSWEGAGLTPDIVVAESDDGDAVLSQALAHLTTSR